QREPGRDLPRGRAVRADADRAGGAAGAVSRARDLAPGADALRPQGAGWAIHASAAAGSSNSTTSASLKAAATQVSHDAHSREVMTAMRRKSCGWARVNLSSSQATSTV